MFFEVEFTTKTPNELQVTKRIYATDEEWMQWNWRSAGDQMLNGAYFFPSGGGAANSYALASVLGGNHYQRGGRLTRQVSIEWMKPYSAIN